jgi:ferredoxin
LVDVDSDKEVSIKIPSGEVLQEEVICRKALDADVLINVPVMKNHVHTMVTLGLKNVKGLVPKRNKHIIHLKGLDEGIVDLNTVIRSTLVVVDAIVGMDGDGPGSGDPFPIGAILAAPDPVALDVAALSLVCDDPTSVPTIAAAIRRGQSSGRVEDLMLLGDDHETLKVKGFRMPQGGWTVVPKVPPALARLGTGQMVANPVVTARCEACEQCVHACPAHSIAMDDGRARIDLRECIRCYCCHEVCPARAIELHRPPVAQLLARLGF